MCATGTGTLADLLREIDLNSAKERSRSIPTAHWYSGVVLAKSGAGTPCSLGVGRREFAKSRPASVPTVVDVSFWECDFVRGDRELVFKFAHRLGQDSIQGGARNHTNINIDMRRKPAEPPESAESA